MALPRGIRNNNAGNIRHSSANWKGQSLNQPDAGYLTFDSPEYGIRAMVILLRNYEKLHGLNTVRGIIDRWAPPIENNTNSYVSVVSRALGVNENDVIDLNSQPLMLKLVKAIIKHENGQQPYSDTTILEGLAMAGVSKTGTPLVMADDPVIVSDYEEPKSYEQVMYEKALDEDVSLNNTLLIGGIIVAVLGVVILVV